MGSSCFCRGNARNAELLAHLLREEGMEESVQLSGTLCEGRCKEGPNLRIDGLSWDHGEPGMLTELVRNLGRNSGTVQDPLPPREDP